MNVDTKEDFKQIYDTIFPILYRIAFRIAGSSEEAEDLCHEAFFKMHEKEMVFPCIDEAKYWLIRVVKNASLNYAKRKSREREVYQKAFRESRQQNYDSAQELLDKEAKTAVSAALEKLSDNLKGALILKEYGELNYKEIGRILGISEGNVKVRIFRARERFAVILIENHVIDD